MPQLSHNKRGGMIDNAETTVMKTKETNVWQKPFLLFFPDLAVLAKLAAVFSNYSNHCTVVTEILNG